MEVVTEVTESKLSEGGHNLDELVREQKRLADQVRLVEAENAALKAERANLVKQMDQLQRESPHPLAPSPAGEGGSGTERRWEVMSLVHELSGGEYDGNEDDELAEALNDGWEVVEMSHTTTLDSGSGLVAVLHFRMVTLKRLVAGDPAPDGSAKARVGESPHPLTPSPTGEVEERSDPVDSTQEGSVYETRTVGTEKEEPEIAYIMPGEIIREPVCNVDLESLTYEQVVREHIPLSSADIRYLANRDLVSAVFNPSPGPSPFHGQGRLSNEVVRKVHQLVAG